ncbi:MAG: hypothetical protein E7168_05465 [Firmicutes bacterium]|nr:hypothetical protein [Bacillota bacterium]
MLLKEVKNMIQYNSPSLDLHGLDRLAARILVNDFIHDNFIMRNERVVIIHGIGTGILKKEVHKTLKQNKLVESYKLDNFNSGATLVTLKMFDKNDY